jgi:hypothetical protein
MPFDELKARALEALSGRREAYHSAVATAVDEVRSILDAQKAPENGKGPRAASELGNFAAGRIDPERFGALFSEQERLDGDARERVAAALEVLTELVEQGPDLHTVTVPTGGDLTATVRTALGGAGRAFAAGRAVAAARSGTRGPDPLAPFPPERWNRSERTVAPPLVVQVDGADLRPAGLADCLEGAQTLVLLVRKPAPPAALARLIVPGCLVVQATGADGLAVLADWDGPAIVAVVPDGAAVFSFVPDDGAGELRVESVPEERLKPLGTMSVARQEAELELLRLLEGAATGRVVAAAGAPAEPSADPTDKLAAWLLRQATIPEPGEA